MRGLSETVGLLIVLLILIGTLVPVSLLLLSQPTNQEHQIEADMPFEKIAELQYADLKPVGNILAPAVFFIYNPGNNSVEFIIDKQMPIIPLEIEYLLVFNGTKWIKLGVTNDNGKLIAQPNDIHIPILINGNTTIYLPIKPYEQQASYVVAVTQYGNVIYAVEEALASKYIYEAFSLSSNYSLPDAFPDYIKYYPANSTQYWNLGLPVLQLADRMQNGTSTEGIVFWVQNYTDNRSFSIVAIGTYSDSWFFGGHGLSFYLFLNPDKYQWCISPLYNSSNRFLGFSKGYEIPGGSGGVLGFPASQGKYIVVSWDPGWATYELELGGVRAPHGNGMWDLFIINNANGVYPQIQTLDLGNGSGLWIPQPNDFIIINVTYDPLTDMLYGFAYDYNTSETSIFEVNLANVFTPPKTGNYIFGIASGNGWLQANWGIIYTNVPFLQHLFSPELQGLINNITLENQNLLIRK